MIGPVRRWAPAALLAAVLTPAIASCGAAPTGSGPAPAESALLPANGVTGLVVNDATGRLLTSSPVGTEQEFDVIADVSVDPSSTVDGWVQRWQWRATPDGNWQLVSLDPWGPARALQNRGPKEPVGASPHLGAATQVWWLGRGTGGDDFTVVSVAEQGCLTDVGAGRGVEVHACDKSAGNQLWRLLTPGQAAAHQSPVAASVAAAPVAGASIGAEQPVVAIAPGVDNRDLGLIVIATVVCGGTIASWILAALDRRRRRAVAARPPAGHGTPRALEPRRVARRPAVALPGSAVEPPGLSAVEPPGPSAVEPPGLSAVESTAAPVVVPTADSASRPSRSRRAPAPPRTSETGRPLVGEVQAPRPVQPSPTISPDPAGSPGPPDAGRQHRAGAHRASRFYRQEFFGRLGERLVRYLRRRFNLGERAVEAPLLPPTAGSPVDPAAQHSCLTLLGTSDGEFVFAELGARTGIISVVGDEQRARRFVATLAGRVAGTRWGGDASVVAIGFPPEVAVPEHPRITCAGSVREVPGWVSFGLGDEDGRALAVLFGRAPNSVVAEQVTTRLVASGRLLAVVAGEVPGAARRWSISVDGWLDADGVRVRVDEFDETDW